MLFLPGWEILSCIWGNKSSLSSLQTSIFAVKSPRKILIPAFMFNTPQTMGKGPAAKEQRCPSYKAYFRVTPESRVRIFFLKRHLPAEIIQLHFGKGQFEMPFTYELPACLLLKLGLETYKIQSGLYPVMEERDFISVVF